MDTRWMKLGRCVDQPATAFFPSDGVGVEIAKKICSECQVKDSCLDYALTLRIDHGVWGGCSERQRRRLLRARKLQARKTANAA